MGSATITERESSAVMNCPRQTLINANRCSLGERVGCAMEGELELRSRLVVGLARMHGADFFYRPARLVLPRSAAPVKCK